MCCCFAREGGGRREIGGEGGRWVRGENEGGGKGEGREEGGRREIGGEKGREGRARGREGGAGEEVSVTEREQERREKVE